MMAREHANIRLDMWGDVDVRDLSESEQRLYMLLMSHPKTNRAGVSEWHPGRLSQFARDTTPESIVVTAAGLVERLFLVIDETTEEVLIRSYIKHDGVLKQPNMTTTMANDYAGVASTVIRGVIAFEVQKLQERDPSLAAWTNHRVQTILAAPSTDPRSLTHRLTHPVTHVLTQEVSPNDPIGSPIGSGSPTSTTTSTEASLLGGDAKLKEHRLPKDWVPTKAHFDLAAERRVDLQSEVAAFRLHAETHDRHAARWNAAFTTWLKKSKPVVAKAAVDWMNR